MGIIECNTCINPLPTYGGWFHVKLKSRARWEAYVHGLILGDEVVVCTRE